MPKTDDDLPVKSVSSVRPAGIATNQKYDAAQIDKLEGLEAVRKRPGMYIGDPDERGLHHMVFEVVDNSIDEHLAGFCDKIEVMVHVDGSVSVRDNGRGIPVDIHPKWKMPAVELVLTNLHAGGKFGQGAYKYSGGLHGVGAKCTNALSDWFKVEVTREGKVYHMAFERGKTTEKLSGFAALERHVVNLALARDFDLEPIREGVGAFRADAMQAAGIFVCALTEFSASVEIGQHQFHRRHFPFRMNIDWNAAAVVAYRNAFIDVYRYFNLVAKSGQMFVDRIIDNFENHVMQAALIGIADVHARPLPNRFEPFEFIDLGGVVLLCAGDASRAYRRDRFHGQIIVGFGHRRWSRDHRQIW